MFELLSFLQSQLMPGKMKEKRLCKVFYNPRTLLFVHVLVNPCLPINCVLHCCLQAGQQYHYCREYRNKQSAIATTVSGIDVPTICRRASKGLQTSIVFTLLDKLGSTAAGSNGSGWNTSLALPATVAAQPQCERWYKALQ